MLALTDAFGDLYVQRPLQQHDPALRIHLRRTQSNRMGAAVKRVLESNEDLGMMILAMSTSRCAAMREVAKQRGEEVTIVRGIRRGSAA